jgi:hypothetical protein
MRDLLRVGATGFVWVVFAFFMLGLFAMASEAYNSVYFLLAMAITATLALFAFFLTARIWGQSEPKTATRSNSRNAATESSSNKAKREYASRLETLMETLDEDEMIELESLLTAREEHWAAPTGKR